MLNSNLLMPSLETLTEEMDKDKKEKRILTPKELVEKTNEIVIGQHSAKRIVATEIYKQLMNIRHRKELMANGQFIKKNNIILTGQSGCGKTFLVKTMCEIAEVPYVLVDASKITSEGYVGASVSDIYKKIFNLQSKDIEFCVVILDEIDKKAGNPGNERDTADVGGQKVQFELLKMLEGDEVQMRGGYTFSTENILFIGCGSFSEKVIDAVRERLEEENKLNEKKETIGFGREAKKEEKKIYTETELRKNITRDDLIVGNMIPELIGRFNIIANLLPLTLEDYKEIIRSKSSAFTNCNALFELLEKKLVIDEKIYDVIAEEAFENNVVGVRAVNGLVGNILNYIVYNLDEFVEEEIIVNEELLEEFKKKNENVI